MKTVKKHHQIVRDVLTDYYNFLDTYSELNPKLIINREGNVYLLIIFGEHQNRSVYECLVHLEIIEERINILRDNIKIIHRLLVKGVERDLITNKHYHYYDTSIDLSVNLKKIYELNQSLFASEFDDRPPVIKPHVTAAELIELSKIECNYIGKAIVIHPNITPFLLIKLFLKFPSEVFNNPNFNKFVKTENNFLEKLYDSFPGLFYQENLEIPQFFIEWAVNQPREDIRACIAGSRQIKISIPLLEKLAEDRSCIVIANLIARFGYDCENNIYPEYIMNKIWKRYKYFGNNCPKLKEINDEYDYCYCEEILANM